ncbi:MAG: SDR family oxidoreductase [Armatimonadota bacterium]|nr:SDR family oxidoreductase [Armatimonadota bacterium]
MTDLFSLSGKRVLVTGGTRGIGRAISLHFVRHGAHVLANYAHREEAAAALLEEAGATAGHLELCRADLTLPSGIRRIVEAVGAGPLAALIHCAATGVHRPLPQLTLRHWDFTFALNLRAFFELVRTLLPSLAPGASVVAVSSEGAVHAFPNYTLVGTTKGGLEALCRHLALELAPRGIRVNALSPGSVPTESWEALPESDRRRQEALARSPRGELTTPEEVAWAAHFLCCQASKGVNGHTLVVDGGQRIRG